MAVNKTYTKDILLQVTPAQHEQLRVYAEGKSIPMQVVLRGLIESLPDKKTRRVTRRKK